MNKNKKEEAEFNDNQITNHYSSTYYHIKLEFNKYLDHMMRKYNKPIEKKKKEKKINVKN